MIYTFAKVGTQIVETFCGNEMVLFSESVEGLQGLLDELCVIVISGKNAPLFVLYVTVKLKVIKNLNLMYIVITTHD